MSCPKCGGNEILESVNNEWEVVCLQCGRRVPAVKTPVPVYANENTQSRSHGGKWGHRQVRTKPKLSSVLNREGYHKPETIKKNSPAGPRPRLIGSIDHRQDEHAH